MIRQKTSKLLFQYWNGVRGDRTAPNRYEIEPSKIAALLPETVIVETEEPDDYRVRLAGTRICDQFGQELRGRNLLDFWNGHDREGAASALVNVASDGAVAVFLISGTHHDGRRAEFEMVLMPLVHAGHAINRILGCITAIDPPIWLGTGILRDFSIGRIDLVWPGGQPPALVQGNAAAVSDAGAGGFRDRIVADAHRRFRVLQGGLSGASE